MLRMLPTLWLSASWAAAVMGAEAPLALDPGNTYGVVVGVLEWADPATLSFSKADRQDRVLYQTLRRRGIPKRNLRLLLDRDATRDAVLEALKEQAASAGPDSTFLFYYGGHGARTSRGAYFANYDQDADDPEAGLSVNEIAETLAAHFRGGRVLLLADCCHSGCLEQAVGRLADNEISAACVTSVFPAGGSTGNWTYTQVLIDVFRGRPLADRDADGAITFGELQAEVSDAMRYLEEQQSGFANRGWADDWELADAGASSRPSADPSVGRYTLARDAVGWVRGRIVAVRKDVVSVQLQHYSDRPVLQVSRAELRPIPQAGDDDDLPGEAPPSDASPLAPEMLVLVQIGDRMHPATVLECEPGRCRVRFDELDEAEQWVFLERVTKLETEWSEYDVLVEWGGNWWPAIVKEQDGDRHQVHYVGWTDRWDEWVEESRLRRLGDDAS